jgi:hypothetical protein
LDALHQILDWAHGNETALRFLFWISLAMFFGTLTIIPVLVIHIPEDYFATETRVRLYKRDGHPALQLALTVAKKQHRYSVHTYWQCHVGAAGAGIADDPDRRDVDGLSGQVPVRAEAGYAGKDFQDGKLDTYKGAQAAVADAESPGNGTLNQPFRVLQMNGRQYGTRRCRVGWRLECAYSG